MALEAEIRQIEAELQEAQRRGQEEAVRQAEIDLGQVAAAALFLRRTSPAGIEAPAGAVAGAVAPEKTVSPAADAARDFSRLCAEMIALNRTLVAHADKLTVEYARSWDAFMDEVSRFGSAIAHTSIPWYFFPGWILGELGKAGAARFYGAENYNAVQKFHDRFIEFHDEAQKMLGFAPLGVKPTPAAPLVSVTPTADWIKELAGTALTIVLVGGLAYVAGNALAGRGAVGAGSTSLNLKLAGLRPGAAAAGAGK